MMQLGSLALWSLIGAAAMASLLEGAQGLGWSRLSLPFLIGTIFTDNRKRAMIWGYVAYLVASWLFGGLYALILTSFPDLPYWPYPLIGLGVGVLHGIFLISVFLPLLPVIHPRLSTTYDGPEALTRIEPPGPFGLHYGLATPALAVGGQALFGLIFGLGFGMVV